MDETPECSTDRAAMVVPAVGRLVATGDVWEPYRLLDPAGLVVEAVAGFLHDLQAAGRSPATLRSYGMDLLRWLRPVNCTMSLIVSQADRLASQGAWCGPGPTTCSDGGPVLGARGRLGGRGGDAVASVRGGRRRRPRGGAGQCLPAGPDAGRRQPTDVPQLRVRSAAVALAAVVLADLVGQGHGGRGRGTGGLAAGGA
jgi:hypothetical protein